MNKSVISASLSSADVVQRLDGALAFELQSLLDANPSLMPASTAAPFLERIENFHLKHFVFVIKSALKESAWHVDGPDKGRLVPEASHIAARAITTLIFSQRFRNNGFPSISHEWEIQIGHTDPLQKALDYLHDVPEKILEDFAKNAPLSNTFAQDCAACLDECINDLRQHFLPDEVVNAAGALTRPVWSKGSDGEVFKMPYFDYIVELARYVHASKNEYALNTKDGDFDNNLIDDKDEKRTRHLIGKAFLLAFRYGEINLSSSKTPMKDFIDGFILKNDKDDHMDGELLTAVKKVREDRITMAVKEDKIIMTVVKFDDLLKKESSDYSGGRAEFIVNNYRPTAQVYEFPGSKSLRTIARAARSIAASLIF